MSEPRCRLAMALLLLLGCGDAEVGKSSGQMQRGRGPGIQGEEFSEANTAEAADPSKRVTTAQPAAQAKPVAAEAPEKEPERDLGAELQAAFGSPLTCIAPRTGNDVPSVIRIELEAVLSETGLVTRGYTRSGQLGSDELSCLQRRLNALRLLGPIDGAPRSARTTIELKLKPSENSGS